MSGQVYYYVSEYNDEVAPHAPTLEAAAAFLHGKVSVLECEGGEYNGLAVDGEPLAKPGDIIRLDTLTLQEDRTATFWRDDDRQGWTFSPPIPADCNFAAFRFGAGCGWTGDDIFDPHRDIEEVLREYAAGEDRVENIAIGKTGTAQARFELTPEGQPVLVLIGDELEAG